MRIEFLDLKTGERLLSQEGYMIDGEGIVWRDTFHSTESQCAVVSLETFLRECPDVQWRVCQ